MTIRTAVLEARLICGDEGLADDARRALRRRGRQGHRAGVHRRQARRARPAPPPGQGASRYLVEPNVKDGKGGLRDLHSSCSGSPSTSTASTAATSWSSSASSRASEIALFRKAEDFLWAVRCHLHFLTGRAEERLSFDLQREMAVRLGYTEPSRPPGRRALHEALLPGRQGRRRPDAHLLRGAGGAPRQGAAGPEPLARAPRPPPPAQDPRHRPISSSTTTASTSPTTRSFERDPVNLIRIFQLADRHELAVPSRRDAAGHALASADRRGRCATTRRRTGCSSRS